MLEEQTPKGEPTTEPIEEPKEAPPEPEPQIYDGPVEKLKGKPLNEIVDIYTNMESEHDKVISESKQVKENLKAYEQWYTQAQSQQMTQRTQPQPQTGESGQVDFYDKPAESFQQLYTQNRSREILAEDAKNAYNNAQMYEFMAKQQYPNEFDGVDIARVRQVMVGGLQSGQVAPQMVRDPEMWAQTARAIKWRDSGFKEPAQVPKPAAPPMGETPSATRTQTATPEATLSPEMKDIANMFLDGDTKKIQQLADETMEEEAERKERETI